MTSKPRRDKKKVFKCKKEFMDYYFPKLMCFLQGHILNLADLSPRDRFGNISWPCSRCGFVQVKHCGLSCEGKIIQ